MITNEIVFVAKLLINVPIDTFYTRTYKYIIIIFSFNYFENKTRFMFFPEYAEFSLTTVKPILAKARTV